MPDDEEVCVCCARPGGYCHRCYREHGKMIEGEGCTGCEFETREVIVERLRALVACSDARTAMQISSAVRQLTNAIDTAARTELLDGITELDVAGRRFAEMSLRHYGGGELAAALEVSRSVRDYVLAARPHDDAQESVEPAAPAVPR